MKIHFLFLDGVGLGENNPLVNPIVRASMPFLDQLLEGRKLIIEQTPFSGNQASVVPLDACLGVPGFPQSATGQATLLSGINVPAKIGYHYGPKPNPEVASFLSNGNLFSKLMNAGKHSAFLNAYPPAYFKNIQSGRRLFAAIPLAATSAGLPLRTIKDLQEEQAISADFTASGWREHLGLEDVPVYTPIEAGNRLAHLAQTYDFSLFEYWLSDYAGHQQDMPAAIGLLETLDPVLEGLCAAWDFSEGLILVTSDHGNIEDLSTRRHTQNPVPALLIGNKELRWEFEKGLKDISGIAPAIVRMLNPSSTTQNS